ncbi:MAG TPA: hypothetical protein V6C76_06295 [Drouetiella sp.]
MTTDPMLAKVCKRIAKFVSDCLILSVCGGCWSSNDSRMLVIERFADVGHRSAANVGHRMVQRMLVIQWFSGHWSSNGAANVGHRMVQRTLVIQWFSGHWSSNGSADVAHRMVKGCWSSNGSANVGHPMAQRILVIEWCSGCWLSNGAADVGHEFIRCGQQMWFSYA